MSNLLKRNIFLGSIWTIIGKFSTLTITLITNIWLARLLSPKEYGQLGIIMFFISIADVMTQGGLGGALIRKPKIRIKDYSTMFIFNFAVSVILFLILLFSASPISLYYNDYALRFPLIISGSVLIFNALSMVQNTRLIAEMNFRRILTYDFTSNILSSIIGVFLAYQGLGLWSLIYMILLRSLFKTLFLWVFESFHFKLVFDVEIFKSLYGFGIDTTLASFIKMAFSNIYQLIIGKTFSIAQVGFFYQATKLVEVPNGVLTSLSQGPIYSGLSKIQNNKLSFTSSYDKIISILVILLGFITIISFYYSDTIVYLVLGEKWLESGIFIKYLSVASYFKVLEYFNRIIFKVYNQTRKLLYLEILKVIIQLVTIIVGVYLIRIDILLMGYIITNISGYLINLNYTKKILEINNRDHLFFIFKNIMMVISVLGMLYIFKNSFVNPTTIYPFLLILILYPILLSLFGIYKISDLNLVKFINKK